MTAPAGGDATDGDRAVAGLLDALRGLGRIINSRTGHTALQAATGLVVSQQGSRLLQALPTRGPATVSEAARGAHLDLAAASRQLQRLEADGLVGRQRTTGDGRNSLVALTASGRRAAARLRDVEQQLTRQALRDWDPVDVDRAATVLAQLVTALEPGAGRGSGATTGGPDRVETARR